MFYPFVGTIVALAGVAIWLFYDANSMRLANAAPVEVDTETVAKYAQGQQALLSDVGPADERALGGTPGQSKLAEQLGASRVKVEDAVAVVTAEIQQEGQVNPPRLTEGHYALLEKLEMGNVTPKMIQEAAENPEMVQAGMTLFGQNCAACHGQGGGGMTTGANAPNLTDRYYLHGRGPSAVYKVIKKGVAAKGMPGWSFLGEEKMTQLSAYVLSIEGTHVEGGKAPQGVDVDGNPPPAASDG